MWRVARVCPFFLSKYMLIKAKPETKVGHQTFDLREPTIAVLLIQGTMSRGFC